MMMRIKAVTRSLHSKKGRFVSTFEDYNEGSVLLAPVHTVTSWKYVFLTDGLEVFSPIYLPECITQASRIEPVKYFEVYVINRQ